MSEQFKTTELNSTFETYYKDKNLSGTELQVLLKTAQNIFKKSTSEADKKIILEDINVLQDYINKLPGEQKQKLQEIFESTRNQLASLQEQVLFNQGKTESKERFESNKKNYETLQQSEIEAIKSQFDLALTKIQALEGGEFEIKNIQQIKDFLNSLKVGDSIYTEKNADGSWKTPKPTIFDKAFTLFHDSPKNPGETDSFDTDAQNFVNELGNKIDEILGNTKTNGAREFIGGIGGYEIKDGSQLSKKLNEIFSTQNNIDGKTRKDVEDAIKSGKLVTIEINTDKDGKKTYKYFEIDLKNPNQKGSLIIKETKTSAGETKLTQQTQDFVNTLKFPLGEYKTKTDFENALKAKTPITLEKQQDGSYKILANKINQTGLLVVVPGTPATQGVDAIQGTDAQAFTIDSNIVTTDVLAQTENVYSFESQYSSYLKGAIDTKGNIDWSKLGMSGNLPKNYEELKNSSKSLVITISVDGKVNYKLDARAYAPIYIKKEAEKTTSKTGYERLTLQANGWNKLDNYTDSNSDLYKIVASEKFVKHMQTINNTLAYRDFIKLAQNGNYEKAAYAIVEKLKVPGITKALVDQLTSAEKRKLVDDTIEAAFGDETSVKNHFEIKLNHLKANGLENLVDDYQRIKTKFESSNKETQITGLMTVLSLRNLQNGTIIQQGFTTHTEVYGSDSMASVPANEFSKTKAEFLKDIQLTADMKKNYLASRGLEGLTNEQAIQAWNTLVTGKVFDFGGKKYSLAPNSEKLTAFLVGVCQNPGLKYEFELQVETKTNSTTPLKPEYIPLRAKVETRSSGAPRTITNQAQASFKLPATPGTPAIPGNPGTQGSETPYEIEETPGSEITTDTYTPDEIPGTLETITPPDTTPGVTIDHPTPKPPVPEKPEPQEPTQKQDNTVPGQVEADPSLPPITPPPSVPDPKQDF